MVELKSMHSPKLDDFLSNDTDGVFYISHASILVRLSNKLFLFDPVLAKPPHLGSWLFFPEMILDKRLLDVDAVFVSHQHLDHCDTDFLKQLPKETPIYILADRPHFKKMFTDDGVTPTELEANKLIKLPEGIDFVGIHHDYNNIDSALTISNGNFTVYHGNDCYVSDERIDVVKQLLPTIDVACVPFAYVHWYPFLLDEVDEKWKKEEADKLIKKYLDYGCSQIKKLEPKVTIPFGANMFFNDGVESDHNKAVLTPFAFKEYADKENFEMADTIYPLFAADYVYKHKADDTELEIHQAPFTPNDLKESLSRFVEEMKVKGTGWDLRYLDEVPNTPKQVDTSFIAERLSKSDIEKLDHLVYISNQEHPDKGYIEVDLQSGTAQYADKINKDRAFHNFKLTDLAFRAYASKTFSFNEMVATSQFRLYRLPNEYNLPALNFINNVL